MDQEEADAEASRAGVGGCANCAGEGSLAPRGRPQAAKSAERPVAQDACSSRRFPEDQQKTARADAEAAQRSWLLAAARGGGGVFRLDIRYPNLSSLTSFAIPLPDGRVAHSAAATGHGRDTPC
jgi:hypothetical protein